MQHLLISGCAARPAGGSWDFVLDAAAPHLAFLRDHAVSGRLLLPGAALFELALAAGRTLAGVHSRFPVAVTGASIAAPVMLTSGSASVTLHFHVDLVAAEVVISTGGNARGQQPAVHFTARTAMVATTVPVHSLLTSRPTQQTALTEVAAAANAAPSSQAARARGVADMAFDGKQHGDGFVVHPAVVDCCMHVAASLNMPAEDGSPAPLRVPSSVEAYYTLDEVKTGGTCASAALEGASHGSTTIVVPEWSSHRVKTNRRIYDARMCCPSASRSSSASLLTLRLVRC